MLDLTLLSLPFFQRALLVGIILGLLMAPLGVIVVLRRLSFFSDAIGHAALTGIAIGLLLQTNPFISALVFSLLVAIGMAQVRQRSRLPFDTLIGVFFAAAVALGTILIQLTPGYQASLISFLFGDILTISQLDVALVITMTVLALVTIVFAGKPFIAIALDSELARAEGIAVDTYELILLLLLAGVIALAIKMIGVILVTALLIIPAASALNLARSLSSVFILSAIISVSAVITGLTTSATINTASGPTIVLAGAIFFAISLLAKPFLSKPTPPNSRT